MNAIKKFFIAVSVIFVPASLGLPASIALASVTANNVTSPVQNASDIQNLLCNVIGWFIWVVILVSVIMAVYAAWSYATAGDDTEKVVTGRRTLTYAAVGVLVALCAAGVPAIVQSIFGTSNDFGISCLGGGASNTTTQ